MLHNVASDDVILYFMFSCSQKDGAQGCPGPHAGACGVGQHRLRHT